MSDDAKNDEKIIQVRCIGCNKILFETTEDTIGMVIKKCDGCRRMRRVRLPLTQRAQSNTILIDAGRVPV